MREARRKFFRREQMDVRSHGFGVKGSLVRSSGQKLTKDYKNSKT
jgi:hypothetical protein